MKPSNELLQTSYQQLKNRHYKLAILPWGATEAHNFHLPYGTDCLETEVILRQSVQMANDDGAWCIILPLIPFGVNTGQTDIPLTINMMPSTQMAVLRDIAQSVFSSGIDKLLIFNGHGGNDFKPAIREVGAAFPNRLICSCNWFEALKHTSYFTHYGEHADEMETSLMLYLYPELVLPLETAGNGQYKQFRVSAFNKKWAWAERRWTQVTNDTGIGDPQMSTADKGERYFTDLCLVTSQFLKELANTSVNDFYKY